MTSCPQPFFPLLPSHLRPGNGRLGPREGSMVSWRALVLLFQSTVSGSAQRDSHLSTISLSDWREHHTCAMVTVPHAGCAMLCIGSPSVLGNTKTGSFYPGTLGRFTDAQRGDWVALGGCSALSLSSVQIVPGALCSSLLNCGSKLQPYPDSFRPPFLLGRTWPVCRPILLTLW